MEKQRSVKALSIVALLIAVVGLTVAFAAMNRTLTINNTTAKVKAWNIHFANYSTSPSTVIANFNKTSSNVSQAANQNLAMTDTLLSGISVVFNETGTTAYYTFKIMNEGSTNAKITSKSCSTGTETYSDSVNDDGKLTGSLSCNLYYGQATDSTVAGSGTALTANTDILAAGSWYYVYLELDLANPSEVTVLNDDVTFSNISASVTFEQTSATSNRTADGTISNS